MEPKLHLLVILQLAALLAVYAEEEVAVKPLRPSLNAVEPRQSQIISATAAVLSIGQFFATMVPVAVALFVARLYMFPAAAAFGRKKSSRVDDFANTIQSLFEFDEDSLSERQAEVLDVLYAKLDDYLRHFLVSLTSGINSKLSQVSAFKSLRNRVKSKNINNAPRKIDCI